MKWNLILKFQKKIIFPHSEDSDENTSEENYFSEKENNSLCQNIVQTFSDLEDNQTPNFQEIHKLYEINNKSNENNNQIHYENQMNSDDNLELSFESDTSEKMVSEKINIIHKLIVTKDWVDYIYNKPQKDIFDNMNKVIKSDVIRTKSISLHKNVFFYLVVFMLLLLGYSSSYLLIWTSTLKSDEKFLEYGGINKTNKDSNNRKQINPHLPYNLYDEINYSNTSIIIAEPNKYRKIFKGCQFSETSGIFALFFFVFIVYMCIRIAREKYEKYQKKGKEKKVGLNLCHIAVFFFLTLLAFILTLVTEIYISISIAQKTYTFILDMVRTQLLMNSILFICYILIAFFYFKI